MPLAQAANGLTDVCELLLENGAKVHHLNDKRGKSALHAAVATGQVGVCFALLDHLDQESVMAGDLLDKQGYTSLHWAAYKGHASCVELLLQSKDNWALKGNPFTPAHCACLTNQTSCLELLLKNDKAVQTCQDGLGHTPLHVAGRQKSC